MSTMKIKKGDLVRVIAGKDKDKEGKVTSIDAKNNKAIVEGVNMITKHTKPIFQILCMYTTEKLQDSGLRLKAIRKFVSLSLPAK